MTKYHDRFAKLWELLPEQIDGALITSDLNRRYFTGMPSSAGTVLSLRGGVSYLIIDFRYIERARNVVRVCEVLEQKDLFLQLKNLCEKHHIKTLAVEAMTMTLHSCRRLRDALKGVVELDESDALSRRIYDCRTVKMPEEIDKIRAAQRIAEKAFADILEYIRPGRTEWEIMLRLNDAMLKHGSDGESFPTIALAGAHTSMPHGVPQKDRVVKEGDFVLMDYGATCDGYHSDMTRTVCVGKPSEKQRAVYDVVLRAQLACIEAAKPGLQGAEMDKIARDIITEAGYGEAFGHSLGHGVGLEIHEYPLAAPSYKNKLEAGNIITVEPGIYLAGEFGVRIEDFLAITEEGCENLTLAKKELIILG